MDELSIYCTALELEATHERRKYLDVACADNAALRERIETLLRSSAKASQFLENSPVLDIAGSPTTELPNNEQGVIETAGTQIGPYKLLQKIGEGGMGLVFMAEQTHPVRRRVALKVIKPGLDSREVIARFEAERQALAMMDHVNIARVIDAGSTVSGRPYFVMELVHGVPITKYCDENHLTPSERLELFIPVCQAIQHAHQKGIIHRDIKPSNVMVTLYDGKPVPKVIDFGVAKATEQTLTERTLFTQYGTMVGTLEYMSPEQAEMSALGVDTRSDIYSLGVLLYELLTGTTPLDGASLRKAAWQELLKRLKEEEPPRPSLRLSTSGTLNSFAATCRVAPTQLKQMLHGELDWIVMKCLEKDRSRRYETPYGLARDLQRYIADEPVEACPPSIAYRLQKGARKYRWAIATAATFMVLILTGLVASIMLAGQAMRARHEEFVARQAAEAALANETTARTEAEVARKRAELLVVQLQTATKLVSEGNKDVAIGQWAKARENYSQAIATEPNYHPAYVGRGDLYLHFGLWDRAAPDFQRRFELADQESPETHFTQALLSFYVQDREGHRRTCLNFERGNIDSPYVDSPTRSHRQLLARSLALSPSPIIEPEAMAKLGEAIIGTNRNPYNVYVSALAQMRAGNDVQAVKLFQEALESGVKSPMGVHLAANAPLAISLFHLGKLQDARDALAIAEQTLEEWIVATPESPIIKLPIEWKVWLEFHIYMSEAKMLIQGKELKNDQRLIDREKAAWKMLSSVDASYEEGNKSGQGAKTSKSVNAAATKMWVDDAMKNLELPLADPAASPKHISAEYYYQIPEMQLYRSYPVYHPDKEPEGYFDRLQATAPDVIWDGEVHPPLETEADWIDAGELVFEMPIGVGNGRILPTLETSLLVHEADWYREHNVPTTHEGINPFYRYVIREPGKIEVGVLSCAMCHTRVMADGTAIQGAQGNFPFGHVYSAQIMEKGAIENGVRGLERNLFGAPWVLPDRQEGLWLKPMVDLAAAHACIPPGVLVRHRSSPLSPVVVPDLFLLKSRRYLDRTGLQHHRDELDLMRYAALNQGMDNLSQFESFVPAAADFKTLPEPADCFFRRYSDQQLFALAKYVYSLKPPSNPNKFNEQAEHGQKVFMSNGCARCHEPEKNYGSDRLVAAPDFEVPNDHPEKAHIMSSRVNTDSTLTMSTRRGTGFYKVPSLRSAWLRGPFEHNGSVATLEDWFDPQRLEADYVPTGWRGPAGTKTRAVKGHPFGLKLDPEDKSALIAFLKTL